MECCPEQSDQSIYAVNVKWGVKGIFFLMCQPFASLRLKNLSTKRCSVITAHRLHQTGSDQSRAALWAVREWPFKVAGHNVIFLKQFVELNAEQVRFLISIQIIL